MGGVWPVFGPNILFTYCYFNSRAVTIRCPTSVRCTIQWFNNSNGIFVMLLLRALWPWDLSQAYRSPGLCAGSLIPSAPVSLCQAFLPLSQDCSPPCLNLTLRGTWQKCGSSESTCGSVLPASADRRTVLLHAGSAGLCPSVLTELRKHFHWSLVACGLLLWLHTSTGKTLSLKELSVVALGWGRGGRRVVCRELLVLLFDIVSSIWFQLAHTNQN